MADEINVTIDDPEAINVTLEGGVGATNFIQLTDTPSSYSGEADKFLKVNSAADGIEFSSTSSVAWGAITGTLSNQTDLQNALDLKATVVNLDTHVNDLSNPHQVQAEQIPDFDTEVAGNAEVSLNVVHRTSDGTDHSDVVLNNTHRTSDGTDHTYIDQDIRTSSTPRFQGITLDPSASTPSYSEGLVFYDSDNKCMGFYNDNSNATLQIGQELWIRVKNNTGSQIDNGSVVYINGIDSGIPTIALAQADQASTSLSTIAVATVDIPDGEIGLATRIGTVREVNTSGCTPGDRLYLSPDTAGAFTNTRPDSPNYVIFIGTCGVSDSSVGTIEVQIDIGTNTEDVVKIFNGSMLETSNVSVSSTGTTVSLTLDGTGDYLSLFFDGIFNKFSIPDSINLTAGSDTSPTLNYVYISDSTKVLTVNTTGFPTTEQFVPIATVLVQSASSVQTYGVYKLHVWTDHLYDTTGQGHLSDINKWIRNQNATWKSGVSPTASVTTNASAIDNVYFSNTSGNILQLHEHDFPAISMPTDEVYVVNDSTTAYDRINDLGDINTDSTGSTLRTDNTYYSLVVWGASSENESESKLYINVPSGSYSNEIDATNDTAKYTNYQIPSDFKGAGFLIARVLLRYQTADSGTFTVVETEDLRGLVPSTSAGGGSGAVSTTFSDNVFRIFNVSDNTKELDFDTSNISTGTTRTITMPDADVDLGSIGASPLTTKGDIYTYSTTGARLPVGTDGQILSSDSTETTGLKWIDFPTNDVTSVFGRTGAVIANTGDYTASQVTNAFDKTNDDLDDISDGTTYIKFSTTEQTKLTGIEANAEVNNISDLNVTDLTNGGDTILHYHATDRNRSNHTGTQTVSTISDFQTGVTNNSAVLANTAKNTYPTSDATKVAFISVTQSVDLDTMESDITTNNAKVTNATHTGEVTGSSALTIADNVVDEANLKLDTSPVNDYVLTADSTASGGMKWATAGNMNTSVYDSAGVSEQLVGLTATQTLTNKTINAVSMTVSADQSSSDTAYVPNILYGTDSTPPTASGFPIGTIYVQYTN